MSALRTTRNVPRTAVTAVVTVAVVICLIAAAAIFLRGGEETYRVTAFFPRAIGLFERSTVRMLGVEVGRVAEVVPEGDRVRVELDVREGVKIPRSASAIIVPISLISDRYVQLAPVWRGGPALEDGDQIPLSKGVAPAELDDLLATLKRLLQALEPGTPTSPGALGRFIQNADEALAGRGAQLGDTIDTLATLLDVLGRNVKSVDTVITNLDQLFTTLSTHDDTLRATNRGLGVVMSSLAEQEGALEAGTGNLASLVSELGSLVRSHEGDLNEDLQILADVSEVLHRQRDRILANVIWLPVLSKGVMNAFDRENLRIVVRDATPGIKP